MESRRWLVFMGLVSTATVVTAIIILIHLIGE